ncbi:MAG: glycosyltransferase family 2 protein [Acidobacteriaceae bacterium]|nr:glycosyltransferase family 2 protein [Acidobacteriaceae bacterium]
MPTTVSSERTLPISAAGDRFAESDAVSQQVKVSIVMPCLNEAETLATCIRKAFAAIDQAGCSGEVIVADNGSVDGSRQIAIDEGARLVEVPIRGYGAALMAGISASHGKYVLMADADDSYDFFDLSKFVASLDAGADLAMGNRFYNIEPGAMPPLHRYLGNPVLSMIGRVFFRIPVRDFHCGIRAFRRSSILSLDLRTTGMEFASEMVVRAALGKLRISEVPTSLRPDGRSRAPHLRTWKDGWRHLRFLLIYSPRWLFFYPGLIASTIGLLLSAWLLPGPRTVGGLRLDVDTLVYALGLFMIGVHSMAFAACGKIYAMSIGLLPADRPFQRVFRHLYLERALLLSALLLLVGFGTAVFSVSLWFKASLGELNPVHMLRITLPSMVAILLGFELAILSFFLSLLGMPIRPGFSNLNT